MCSNFEPASIEQLEALIDKQVRLNSQSIQPYSRHVYPKDYCPIIIPAEDSTNGFQVVRGQFGLSPKWASHPVDYSTYNARLESIESKKTFAPPFTHNQFCLVPMQAFFEPYYLDSIDAKNQWQRIYQKDKAAFTIAGMFEFNSHFDEPVYSFTLLTHNADDEAFMRRFHRPEKEKRSIYLVEADNRDNYLQADHKQLVELMSLIKSSSFEHEDRAL